VGGKGEEPGHGRAAGGVGVAKAQGEAGALADDVVQALERAVFVDDEQRVIALVAVLADPSRLSRLISGARSMTLVEAARAAALFGVPIETFVPPEAGVMT
jgi:hypothetical protein